MRTIIVTGVIGLTGLLCAGAIAQQTQPLPGPGSGVIPVSGTVEIGNTPSVNAAQRGDWRVTLADTAEVRVANTPAVHVAAPDFLTNGRRYLITWTAAETEVVEVKQVGASGWIRVVQAGRTRWINLANARAIEETP